MTHSKTEIEMYYNTIAESLEVRQFLLNEILKHYNSDENLEILEIGIFALDFTYNLFETFTNSTITSYDSLSDMLDCPETFLYFAENYKKMDTRLNIVLSKFQESHVLLKKYYDLVVIDVGRHSDNIIKILEKLPKNKNTMLLLPWGTENKDENRRIVLEYLKENNYNVEILRRAWVRIYE
jgi:hypothetical protein